MVNDFVSDLIGVEGLGILEMIEYDDEEFLEFDVDLL